MTAWILSDADWPTPNLVLLNNALRQTGWTGQELTETTWRALVQKRLQDASWERVLSDVRPFLEQEQGIDLLTRENVLRLLRGWRVLQVHALHKPDGIDYENHEKENCFQKLEILGVAVRIINNHHQEQTTNVTIGGHP